jgi:2-polyprenyl-6-methoxyphenol hydroxylase-like FAD-dependent oxidoreductase
VLLLERDLTQPDRIVGELLQPGGFLKLRELGLEDCLDGIDAQRVNGYVMFKQGEQAHLHYPTEEHGPDVAGRAFHNGRLVQRLRQRAAAAPGVSLRQGSVKRLVVADGSEWREGAVVSGVAYRRTGEEEDRLAHASLTVVCDGMYSTLRNGLSVPDIKLPSYFVGLLLTGCRLPVPNQAVVVLANPSPILFYPISTHEVRCLVDVPGLKLPSVASGAMAEHLRSLASQVPPTLRDAYLEAVEAGNFRSMQNKLMAAQPLHQAGALLLGDAFNMRHPLTGGGMTVALSDTKLLCDMLAGPLNLADPVVTAQQTFAYYTRRKPWAATINTLANALYKARYAAAHAGSPSGVRFDTRWHTCRCSATRASRGARRCGRLASTTCGWAASMRRAPSPCCRGLTRGRSSSLPTSSWSRCTGCAQLTRLVLLPAATAADVHGLLRDAHRWAVCCCRCPRRAASSWGSGCCLARVPSSCQSSARRACARCSSPRWSAVTALLCAPEKTWQFVTVRRLHSGGTFRAGVGAPGPWTLRARARTPPPACPRSSSSLAPRPGRGIRRAPATRHRDTPFLSARRDGPRAERSLSAREACRA